MKGIVEERSLLILVVIALAVIVIYVFLVGGNILPAQGAATTDFYISQLCQEWASKECNCDAADKDIALTIKVTGGGNKKLSQLCAKAVYGDETSWNQTSCDRCKKSNCANACPTLNE